MLHQFQHFLRWLQGGSLKLLLGMGGLLLVWGTLAPVGTLVWWFNQNAEMLGLKRSSLQQAPSNPSADTGSDSRPINCYIIFFPGVGDFSKNQLTPGEETFLDRLIQQHPNCVAVRDVFPYSVANKDLSAERFLTPLWQAAEEAKGWLDTADALIKVRNLWRFAISADDRYWPVYNRGIANTVIDRMDAVHPLPQRCGNALNLILIGTSGGVQVALGAAPYLDQWLQNPAITVISLGGTFNGENGLDAIDQMYHLRGQRDWVENLNYFFPSRWPWTVASPFNRAQQQGRFYIINIGPHSHSGQTGYLGLARLKPQLRYVDLTFHTIHQLPIWQLPSHPFPGSGKANPG
uniref:Uncharacterized protein n=1 Tax=Cyanothece sp. (strain PCC 7425 / ATCC 29141) TaxID=395961 RepID=B8HJU8_CYAP4